MSLIRGKQLRDSEIELKKLKGIAANPNADKLLLTAASGALSSVTLSGQVSIASDGVTAVSGLTVSNLAAGVLITSTTLSGHADTKIASSSAMKTYVDAQIVAASNDVDVTTANLRTRLAELDNSSNITIGDNANTTTAIAGALTVAGDLTVSGTTTTVNSTTLTVDDKNIELGSVANPTDITADGGGVTLRGATNKTILWDNTNSNWSFNQSVNLSTGFSFKINNVVVLDGNGAQKIGSNAITANGGLELTSNAVALKGLTTTKWSPNATVASGSNIVDAAGTAVDWPTVAGGGDFTLSINGIIVALTDDYSNSSNKIQWDGIYSLETDDVIQLSYLEA